MCEVDHHSRKLSLSNASDPQDASVYELRTVTIAQLADGICSDGANTSRSMVLEGKIEFSGRYITQLRLVCASAIFFDQVST